MNGREDRISRICRSSGRRLDIRSLSFPMRILLSNDDGYFAPGLAALAEALVVTGGDRRRCARTRPQRRQQLADARPAAAGAPLPQRLSIVNGTPTDCVHLARDRAARQTAGHGGLGHQSWRQHGRRHHLLGNGGRGDGRFPAGHPLDRRVPGEQVGGTTLQPRREWLGKWSSAFESPSDCTYPVLLNVNVPDVPYEQLAGTEVTRLGRRHKAEPVIKSDQSARRDGLLGRRGGRCAGCRGGHGFPCGGQPPGVGDAAADRSDPVRETGQCARLVEPNRSRT